MQSRRHRCAASLFTYVISILPLASLGAQVAAIQPEGAHLLERLAVEAGRVLPSASFPYSGDFLLDSALALAGETESGDGYSLDRLAAEIAGQDAAAIAASLAVRYERYVRPKRDVSFAEYLETVDPLVAFHLSYQLDLSSALYIEATALREFQVGMGVDNVYPSLEGNPVAFENNLVRQGFLYLHSGPFELIFGRHQVSIGPSPFNSILVSPSLPFLDALDLKMHLGRLGMTLLVSTLENSQSVPDVTIPLGSPYAFEETVVLYNTHYFEYDFSFLRMGIGASVIITRPQNAFHISDFFPVFSWHNANIKPNNLSLVFDVSAVPVRGLNLYAQYGFDDVNAGIFGANDSGIPTIGAGLFGAGWYGGWDGYSISIEAETGYTHYLWGNFLATAPLARAIYRMDLDENDRWIPLTSPFGPGVAWFIGKVVISTPWNLRTTASCRLLSKNTAASLTGPYEADPAVRDASRAISFVTGIEAIYAPFPCLEASLAPSFVFEEADCQFELTIAVSARIGGTVRLSTQDERND